jgi:diacylglycerol kinase family enzyme
LKPQRVGVLVNASSGENQGDGRDQRRESLESTFAKHGISAGLDFVPGEELQAHADDALQRAKQGGLDAIVIAGGDGSVRTVAGVLAGSGVPLGIIPLGTLNHFAKDLGIPPAIDEAVAVIASGLVRAVDVGEVNGRIFVNNSSIGLYPYLVLERERHRRHGLSKWMAMILAGLRAVRYFPIRRLSIRAEHWTDPCRSPCVFVGNNTYRLTGPALGGRDRLDEGNLCLYVARQQGRLALFWLACRCVLGLLDEQRDLRIALLPTMDISSHDKRLLVAFDGEVEAMRSPLTYRIRPKVLQVFVPQKSVTDTQ